MLPSRLAHGRRRGRATPAESRLLRACSFPGLQVGQRVDRVSARRLPAADPHLEVQVRSRRVTRLAGEADLLAGGDRLASCDLERARLAVSEHEVEADQGVLDEGVARAPRL